MRMSRSTWSTNTGHGWCYYSTENDIRDPQDWQDLFNSREWTVFPKKISWLHFIFRLQSKILGQIKLSVIVIVSFFHQRKNKRTDIAICSMFKIPITKICNTFGRYFWQVQNNTSVFLAGFLSFFVYDSRMCLYLWKEQDFSFSSFWNYFPYFNSCI